MEYLIAVVVIGIFIGVVMIWAKKESKNLEGYVANLTDEQKNELESTDIKWVEGKKNVWTQKGLVCNINEKNGNKVHVVVLWYNKVIQNDTLNKIQYADVNVKKAEADAHGLKVGDMVNLYIDPEKSAKIIF